MSTGPLIKIGESLRFVGIDSSCLVAISSLPVDKPTCGQKKECLCNNLKCCVVRKLWMITSQYCTTVHVVYNMYTFVNIACILSL